MLTGDGIGPAEVVNSRTRYFSMSGSTQSFEGPSVLCFGPFEFNQREAELRKYGLRLKLQEKPFQILATLLEHPGEVVTREELRERLWAPDTYVDFERGLNIAVNKLRVALGDDPEKPQYVETVRGRGYRFVAEVREANNGEYLPAAKHAVLRIVVPEDEEGQISGSETRPIALVRAPVAFPAARSAGARRWKWVTLGVAVAVLLTTAAILYLRRPAFTERDSVLLADFENTTGEPVFDETLKRALAVKLDESPFLNVFPEQQVRETLRFMGRSPDERLTVPIAREICQRRGAKALLAGSVARLGSQYVVALEAMNCATGDALAREQVDAGSREQVLQAMGRATSSLRGKLGESLSSIQKFDAPIEEVTTASLDGLRAFSLGETQRARGKETEAIPFYEQAIELDPNFAMAYGRLGAIYQNIGESDRAILFKKKAFELRGRTSGREKLYISAHYYQTVTGEIEKAVAQYEVWKQVYPRDFAPHTNLASIYNDAGQFDRAFVEGQEGLRLNPGHVLAYNTTGWAALRLNHVAEAKTIFEKALAEKLESTMVHRGLFTVAFLQSDSAAMQREAELSKGKADEYRVLVFEAQTQAFSGNLREAREMFRQSVEQARRNHFEDAGAAVAAGRALVEANFGNYRQAREEALAALAIAHGRDALGISAAALALAGDAKRAEQCIDELTKAYSADTLVNSVALPSARASVEIQRHNPAKAIDLLRASTPYENGPFVFGQGFLPAYLRGQAYLSAGQGVAAAAEFQRILDHRAAAPFAPVYALARLGLARALALSGDRNKSRRAYEDFLSLWKNADADIPILNKARAEYAGRN